MKKLVLGLSLVSGLALAGCNSSESPTLYDAPKPLDKMTTEEWCAYYAHYLTNPQISAETKATDIKRMHARGCPMQG